MQDKKSIKKSGGDFIRKIPVLYGCRIIF